MSLLYILISELISLQDLVQQLRVTYQKVVEGEGSALIGAKSIVTTAIHFYRSHGHLDVPVCLVLMFRVLMCHMSLKNI